MAQPRFSIGIDLGTTNCAMAFAPLQGDGASEVFAIPQWETLTSVTEAPTLPSFLYRPEPAAAEQLRGAGSGGADWVVGRLARARAGELPGRVAGSAKSWLCHHAIDRTRPILPWGSRDLDESGKISPVRASALLLNALLNAWNRRFAAAGADFRFEAQAVTVTVPASFDAAAQQLTLDAAREAGFPQDVRLLEEPQAAFYRWLERHPDPAGRWAALPERGGGPHHVLIVDIGGGTSDFSLFALDRSAEAAGGAAAATIRRLAVSEHILLGGDNIDLTLAHTAEPRLGAGEEGLSPGQWDFLVARCRDLKEQALSFAGPADEAFTVAVPGRGASLMAGALSARITRGEIAAIILDGFFPACAADAVPRRLQSGLKELGLPYAADSAVTRHLAGFLRDRPPVDAVLFNGGTLYPAAVRTRLVEQLTVWQDGAAPLVLENAEPHLAVARGAARFGQARHQRAERIEAGAARAVFLEIGREAVASGEGEPSLVCILPRGAAPGRRFEVADLDLRLRVNRPVRFQPWSSTRHGRSRAGDLLALKPEAFHPLPPLETTVTLVEIGDEGEEAATVPVNLAAELTELGLIQVACRSADPEIDREWPLSFNLRAAERAAAAGEATATTETEPNVSPAVLDTAAAALEAAFRRGPGKRESLSAARLLKSLETTLGKPRGDWNWVVVRSLWPTLEACMDCRATSVDHEEAWLILAGFLLRPGFGAPRDAERIDSLWRLRRRGLCFPGKRIRLQDWILWRRVAGGLDRERQERILASEIDTLRRQKAPPAELIRLAGSLERIGPEFKAELIDRFLAAATDLAREKKHSAPYLAALGLLLNRAPLSAGPETVVAPERVEQAFEAFERFDWTHPELVELQTLFLRAARVVDDRSLDVTEKVRRRIADKLEKSGVAAQKTAKIRAYIAVDRSDRAGLYGEALPPGLVLSGG